ncbi:MAG: phosphate ABC transporter permease subunit PstC [Microbacteriaceae bacterium]
MTMTQPGAPQEEKRETLESSLSEDHVPKNSAIAKNRKSSATKSVRRLGDIVFANISLLAGVSILLALAGVGVFLFIQSLPALMVTEPGLLGNNADSFADYVAPLIFGTVWTAAIALLFATPVAIGIGLFISHYAPRKLAQLLGYITDLLAAVPSVVYGLWGILVLAPFLQPSFVWLFNNLHWIPFFGGEAVSSTGRTTLTAAVVLAVMILPIMAALMREVFLQTPVLHEEASLALGATRWEMIRMAVLPFGRSGIISAAMLGLGRALGETMAVAMVLSPAAVIHFFVLTANNPNTVAANIALSFPEAYGLNLNGLLGSGLVLFLVTFAVNLIARWVINRRKAFSGANA